MNNDKHGSCNPLLCTIGAYVKHIMCFRRSMIITILLAGYLPIYSTNTIAAFAIAISANNQGGTEVFTAFNQKNLGAAKTLAFNSCHVYAKNKGFKDKCRILGGHQGSNYIAIFKADDGYISYGYSEDRQAAIDRAYSECIKNGRICPDTAANVYEDNIEKIKPTSPQGKSCSPPAGKSVRFEETCNNGDCIRTFENGCTKHFQAPYCFDPVQGKWEWKSDGC